MKEIHFNYLKILNYISLKGEALLLDNIFNLKFKLKIVNYLQLN